MNIRIDQRVNRTETLTAKHGVMVPLITTKNGKACEFSTKRGWEKGKWNAKAGRDGVGTTGHWDAEGDKKLTLKTSILPLLVPEVP